MANTNMQIRRRATMLAMFVVRVNVRVQSEHEQFILHDELYREGTCLQGYKFAQNP